MTSLRVPWVLGRVIGKPGDLLLLILFVAAAAVPRLVGLGHIPPGLHGDEAIAGLEAHSLLRHGTLMQGEAAPYSIAAQGVPAGTFYWAAAVLRILGESAVTVRLAYALLGVAGVAFSYLAFRVMFGRTIASIAALLLAFSSWDLHYSRLAFIPIGWPALQMATLFLFFLAARRNSRWLFGAAGACLGAGFYTYQAFAVFALSLILVIGLIGALDYRGRLGSYAGNSATLLGVALLVGLPMASFAWHHPDLYTLRYKRDSVTRSQDYKRADTFGEKADLLLARERDYVSSLISKPIPDSVDASGIFPFVDRVTLALLIAGGAICLRRLRRTPYAAVLALIVIIGLSPALVEGGWYRRTLGLAPLLALIAALPLAFLWELGWQSGRLVRVIACLSVVAVIGTVAAMNLTQYFGSYGSSQYARRVLHADIVEASNYMARLPSGTYVLYYDRHNSFDYETRQFIAPDVTGESRTINVTGGPSLTGDPQRDLAYVFVGDFAGLLPQVEQLYPGGKITIADGASGETVYAAYYLAHARETATNEQRDLFRQQDLAAIGTALDQYRQKNGSFPDTRSRLETLCVFSSDAACVLKESLDPLPADPLNARDSSRYPYFYASDGRTYRLYARRESSTVPACDEHPAELQTWASVLCVEGR